MVIRAIALASPGTVATVAGRNVRLHPDDRLDALFPGHLVEGPCPEHAAMVGEGEPGHLVLGRLSDQVTKAIRAVEERVFGVRVEVDEAHGRRRRDGG